MVRLRNEVKFAVILLVVLFSFYFGYKRSGLSDAISPKQVAYNTSIADRMFEKLENHRKIFLKFQINDDKELSNVIHDLMFKEGVSTKYSENKELLQLHILEVPNQEIETVIARFRNIDVLVNENIQAGSETSFEADIAENIQNNIITKNRLQAMINRATSPQAIASFRQQLDVVQTKIDSLNNLQNTQNRNAGFDLIYIQAVKGIAGKTQFGRTMQTFLLYTVLALIMTTILLVIAFFFYLGMTRLMMILGIKTKRGSSSRYYGYGYSYGQGKKKIKRKYISQEEAEKKKKEIEKEGNGSDQ